MVYTVRLSNIPVPYILLTIRMRLCACVIRPFSFREDPKFEYITVELQWQEANGVNLGISFSIFHTRKITIY